MALQYGPHPRPHNYNSSDGESEAAPRPTFESCQNKFNKACSVGDLEAVKRYLSHGASVHGMRGCFTPLYHALGGVLGDKSPSFEVARYLIERGADVNKSIYFNENLPRYGYRGRAARIRTFENALAPPHPLPRDRPARRQPGLEAPRARPMAHH